MYLQIAGFTININFLPIKIGYLQRNFKGELLNAFQDFLIYPKPKKIDFMINVTYKNKNKVLYKDNNFFLNLYEYENNGSIITFCWLSMFEFKMILQYILQSLLEKNYGFNLHASAVYSNKKVDIFLGKSGAGKSTAADMLSTRYKKIADDTLIIRKMNEKFYLYQTPFLDKNYTKKTMKKYIIGNIYFLKKAKYFKITKIKEKKQILLLLVKQLLTNGKNIKKQIECLSNFVSSFDNFSFLYFSKNADKFINFIK